MDKNPATLFPTFFSHRENLFSRNISAAVVNSARASNLCDESARFSAQITLNPKPLKRGHYTAHYMGVYKYLSNAWKKNTIPKEMVKQSLMKWRREGSTTPVEYPTRLDRAKALGYRAKQGFLIVRQRVSRGSHRRPDWSGGRHSHNMGARLNLRKSYQLIAEERAGKNYVNCEVLNSYYVAEDGKHYWYEVILVDKSHPAVLKDQRIAWIAQPQHSGRVNRGLTSAGRKVRGLRHKGSGTEKARPSRRAHFRRL